MCKKRWRAYATPAVRGWIVLCLYGFDLTKMSFRDFPLQYDMSEGSVKISLSCGWFCMRCHVFKLGKAGWYCITKGNILVLLFKWRSSVTEFDFREVSCTTLVGFPLFRTRFSKFFFIFSSKVNCEEFVLRSLNASPLIKPFVTPGGWHE